MSNDCAPDSSPSLPLKRAMGPLLLLAGMFFCNFIVRVILSPYLPALKTEFGLSHAQAGGLFLPMSTGLGLALALSGFAARALGHRGTIILSGLGVGLGLTLLPLAPSLNWMRAALFCIGMAAGLYFPSGISAITSLLNPKDWGKALSIHELAPNTCFLLIPAAALAMSGMVSWRGGFVIFGVLSLAMAVVFVLRGQGGEFKGEAPRASVLREVLGMGQFWLLALLFGLAIAASFGPYAMLPLFLLDDHGMDVDQANALLTLSRMAGPFMVLAAGWVVDRFGPRRTAASALVLTGLMIVGIGFLSGPALKAAAIVQPALVACFFPAGLTATSLIFPARTRNVALSLIVPLAILMGQGAAPPLLGWFGDQGMFGIGFTALGAVVVAGALPALRLRYDRDGQSRTCP